MRSDSFALASVLSCVPIAGSCTEYVALQDPSIAYVAHGVPSRTFELRLERAASNRCIDLGFSVRCYRGFDESYLRSADQLLGQFLVRATQAPDYVGTVRIDDVWLTQAARTGSTYGIQWSFHIVDRCGNVVIDLPGAQVITPVEGGMRGAMTEALDRLRPLLSEAFPTSGVPGRCPVTPSAT